MTERMVIGCLWCNFSFFGTSEFVICPACGHAQGVVDGGWQKISYERLKSGCGKVAVS